MTAVVEEASLKTGPILSPKRSVHMMGEGREKAEKVSMSSSIIHYRQKLLE